MLQMIHYKTYLIDKPCVSVGTWLGVWAGMSRNKIKKENRFKAKKSPQILATSKLKTLILVYIKTRNDLKYGFLSFWKQITSLPYTLMNNNYQINKQTVCLYD